MSKSLTKVFKITGIILLSFLVFISVIPYLIPLPQTKPSKSIAELMSESGQFIEIEGKMIYYEDYGHQDAKEAIILVHGFGGSTYSWRHNVKYLSDPGMRVIAVDLLGYGLSDKDYQSDYSHPAHARRLKKLLDAMGIEKAHLAGHSMGGSIVLHFARLYPDYAQSLILAAPAVDTKNFEPNLDSARLISPLLYYPPFKRTGRLLLRGYFIAGNIEMILKSAYHNQNLITKDIYQDYQDRVITGDWDLSLLAATRDYQNNVLNFPLSDINLKVLIITGAHDSWVPSGQVKELKDQLPKADLKVISDAGHLMIEEQPDKFNEALDNFFKQNF